MQRVLGRGRVQASSMTAGSGLAWPVLKRLDSGHFRSNQITQLLEKRETNVNFVIYVLMHTIKTSSQFFRGPFIFKVKHTH